MLAAQKTYSGSHRCHGGRAAIDAARTVHWSADRAMRILCTGGTVTATMEDSRAGLVAKVAGLRPRLQATAGWTEENGRLHEETIDLLADAGVFRMRTPRRYGGYRERHPDPGRGRHRARPGHGSIGWTASVYWIPTWMVGLFPDPVQDEVFATPDVRVCGTLSPSAMAAPVARRRGGQRQVGLHHRRPAQPLAGDPGGPGRPRTPSRCRSWRWCPAPS